MGIGSALLATMVFIFFIAPGFIFYQRFSDSDRGILTSARFYQHLIKMTLVSAILYISSYSLLVNILPVKFFGLCSTFFYSNPAFEELKYKNIDNAFLNEVQDAQKIIPRSITQNPITDKDRKRYMTKALSALDQENYSRKKEFLNGIECVGYLVISSILLAFFFGAFLRRFILIFNLDTSKKLPFLKFQNEWFYLLTGRLEEMNKSTFPHGCTVQAHLLCVVAGHPVIYKGTIDDFKLNIDGAIDYIYLTAIERTGFASWENSIISPNTNSSKSLSLNMQLRNALNRSPEFYPILGDRIIFKASDILNLHLTYLPLPKVLFSQNKANM